MRKEYILKDVEASKLFAKELASKARESDVYFLYGELGAGKTFFVTHFCKEIGVEEFVSSPSYVLLNQYKGSEYPIFHLDLYRLGSEEEVYELGITDFIDGGITFVEWPNIAEEILPAERVEIYFEIIEDYRKAVVIDRRKNGT
ncbi:MAG: tRNA (adenosine(37)-N6)-threonylcarbamoyltransferase complex ATPase subunit type 1 TsaE [Candidatus Cloacimonetes bacterium 4572_65]|nr:MAG: tRNA (adenosine(37)-N6)-threonylcarbamoyltransferase complex ATPase subunit type 1 TsaE [Candidatus Cloacimonetes bacterium 4572_65]